MPAPKYNVIAAESWDTGPDGGPTSAAYHLGDTDDPSEVCELIQAAHADFVRQRLPGRAWVTDADGRPFQGLCLSLLAHWQAAKGVADAHIAACRGVLA